MYFLLVCLFIYLFIYNCTREAPVRVRACVCPNDIDEHTHVAVSRKCRRLVLDVPLPLCLD